MMKGSTAVAGQNKKRGLLQEIWKCKQAYLFLLPLFAGLIIFSYYPPVSGIMHSFFEWSGSREGSFIGVANYKRLFHDEVFLNSIPTMFKIMIPRLLIGIVAPLIMAELIFCVKSAKLQAAYRVMILLPIVAPGVVGLLIWKNVLDPTSGLLTTLARLFGFAAENGVINWLGDPKLVIFSIIFMGFPWIGGTSVLIYTSGLMNISEDVFDAARLDGVNILQRIRRIDLPLIRGQIRYFFIFGIISSLQDYGTQMVLTEGGPGYSTYVPGYYMYIQAFGAGNMGYACSIGTTLFVFIVLLTLLGFRVTRNKDL